MYPRLDTIVPPPLVSLCCVKIDVTLTTSIVHFSDIKRIYNVQPSPLQTSFHLVNLKL